MPPANYDPRIKLLQFVHRLYTDRNFQAQFQAAPEECMTDYGLTNQQKVAVYNTGVDPAYVVDGVPLVSEWWREYALYKQDPKNTPYPDRKKYARAEREIGELSSMAGLVALIAVELAENDQYQEAW